MENIPFGTNAPRIGAAAGRGLAQPMHRMVDLMQQDKLQQMERKNALAARREESEDWLKRAESIGLPKSLRDVGSLFRPEDRLKSFGLAQSVEAIKNFDKQLENALMLQKAWNDQSQPQQQQSISGAQSEPDMQKEAYDAAGIVPQQVPQGMQQQQASRGQPPMSQQGNPFDSMVHDLMNQRNQVMAGIGANPEDKRHADRLAQGERKIANQEKNLALSETKESRKKIQKEYDSAKVDLAKLDQLEELTHKGNLDDPLYVSVLEHLGIDFPSLLTADSQEYRKIEKSFLNNARDIFGARIPVQEMQMFLQTLPSLSNTKEGRLQIIKNMRSMYRGRVSKYKAMQDVISKNPVLNPLTFDFEVNKKSEKFLDREASAFSKLADENRNILLDEDPIKYAYLLPEGTEGEDDGKKVFIKNGKWVDEAGNAIKG